MTALLMFGWSLSILNGSKRLFTVEISKRLYTCRHRQVSNTPVERIYEEIKKFSKFATNSKKRSFTSEPPTKILNKLSDMSNYLSTGTVLHSNFRIDGVLGQGGYGITYLATDLTLERTVAIKEFFPKEYCHRGGEMSPDSMTISTPGNIDFIDRLKAKFLKEARNIAKLDCQYIIKIYTAFEANDTAYYVMEYIEGLNLRDVVKNTGALTAERAVGYIEKIGEALEYLHARHINHLDVKPANIMVRSFDDRPILIDFGLSKQYDSDGRQTSTTPTGLSHGFAPIEQYKDGGVSGFTPQTDLYSLAATLYYLLTASVPPQAADLITEPLDFPKTLPKSIIAPIRKAMAVNLNERHESVASFIKELNNIRENDKIDEKDKTKILTDKTTVGKQTHTVGNKTKTTQGNSAAPIDMQIVLPELSVAKRKKQKRRGVTLVIAGLIVALFFPFGLRRISPEDCLSPDNYEIAEFMGYNYGGRYFDIDKLQEWYDTASERPTLQEGDTLRYYIDNDDKLSVIFNHAIEDGIPYLEITNNDYGRFVNHNGWKIYVGNDGIACFANKGDTNLTFLRNNEINLTSTEKYNIYYLYSSNNYYLFGNFDLWYFEEEVWIGCCIIFGIIGLIMLARGIVLWRRSKLPPLSNFAQFMDRYSHRGKRIFKSNDKFGVIKATPCKVILPAEYDDIYWDNSIHRFRATKNNVTATV